MGIFFGSEMFGFADIDTDIRIITITDSDAVTNMKTFTNYTLVSVKNVIFFYVTVRERKVE